MLQKRLNKSMNAFPNINRLNLKQAFYFVGVSHVPLIALKLDCLGTWHRFQCWGLDGEWRNFMTEKKLHWL